MPNHCAVISCHDILPRRTRPLRPAVAQVHLYSRGTVYNILYCTHAQVHLWNGRYEADALRISPVEV